MRVEACHRPVLSCSGTHQCPLSEIGPRHFFYQTPPTAAPEGQGGTAAALVHLFAF